MADFAKQRRQARTTAKERGHDLGNFDAGGESYLATCRNCYTWVEVSYSGEIRFGHDGPCKGEPNDD